MICFACGIGTAAWQVPEGLQLSQPHFFLGGGEGTRVNVEKGAAGIDSAIVAGSADLCLEQLVSQSVSCFEKKVI